MEVDANVLGAELSTAIVLFHEAVARELGLSAIDHKALGLIQGGPLTASQLAHRLSMKPSAVTALVDRLVKAGYAERIADADDRRRVLIVADPGTRQRLGRIFAELGAAMAGFMSRYDERELAAITDWITNTTTILTEQTRRLAS